jgi:uncharacterized delta-60 repeat protein
MMLKSTIAIRSSCAAVMLLAVGYTIQVQATPGDLDPSFGNNGVVTTLITGNGAFLGNSALQTDGKIVVVGGNKYAGDQYEPYVARYNTDGTLDQSFGAGGIVFTRFTIPGQGANEDNGQFDAVAIQSDGKILAAGGGSSLGFSDAILARYNSNGSLDSSFGSGGQVMTQTNTGLFQGNLNGNTTIYSLQVALDNTFYAVGGGQFNLAGGQSNSPIVLHYSASGALLGLNRIVVVPADFNGASNFGYASVLQPDGKLIFTNIGGFIANFILVRINSDLSLDSTFGTNGVVQTSFDSGAGVAQANGIVLDPNARIVASGGSNGGNSSTGNFFAASYDSNGGLDTSFGNGGKVTVLSSNSPFTNKRKGSLGLVRQPDGKYVSGSESFGAIRLLSSGVLDTTFGVGGLALYQDSEGYQGITGFGAKPLLQSDAKIILPGSQQDGNDPATHGVRMLRLVNQLSSTASDSMIRGETLNSDGTPLAGVAIHLSGTQDRLTITDGDGTYYFDDVETNGFYSIVPSRANYSFSPAQRSFSALGQHSDAVFTATSQGGGLNPLDATEYFVRQHYLDFLNREPDEKGFKFWVNNIESCGADQNCREIRRIDTSAAFFLSIEFQQTGYLVYRMYNAAYGEMPNAPVPVEFDEFKSDTQEIGSRVVVNQSGWQQVLEINKQAFALEFVQRPRFTSAFPATMAPSEFVGRLFMNAGVTPTEGDRALAISEFESANTSADMAARGRALRRVTENSVLQRQHFNQAFVLLQYFGYLRRDPNKGQDTNFDGYTFWLNKLNSFGNFRDAEMVRAFLVSVEYRGRFPR